MRLRRLVVGRFQYRPRHLLQLHATIAGTARMAARRGGLRDQSRSLDHDRFAATGWLGGRDSAAPPYRDRCLVHRGGPGHGGTTDPTMADDHGFWPRVGHRSGGGRDRWPASADRFAGQSRDRTRRFLHRLLRRDGHWSRSGRLGTENLGHRRRVASRRKRPVSGRRTAPGGSGRVIGVERNASLKANRHIAELRSLCLDDSTAINGGYGPRKDRRQPDAEVCKPRGVASP